MIHGSAVRVLGQAAAVRPEQNRGALVCRGDTVDVVMKRGGITIEAIGVALVNARPGQRLSVELKGNKNLRGILREGRVVEVEL
jgi:flagella basal body P-ring formation protein FlgA